MKMLNDRIMEFTPLEIRITMIIISEIIWILDTIMDHFVFLENESFLYCLLFNTQEIFTRSFFAVLLMMIGEVIIYGRRGIIAKEKEMYEAEKLAYRRGIRTIGQEIRNKIILSYQAFDLVQSGRIDKDEAIEVSKKNMKQVSDILEHLINELESP